MNSEIQKFYYKNSILRQNKKKVELFFIKSSLKFDFIFLFIILYSIFYIVYFFIYYILYNVRFFKKQSLSTTF